MAFASYSFLIIVLWIWETKAGRPERCAVNRNLEDYSGHTQAIWPIQPKGSFHGAFIKGSLRSKTNYRRKQHRGANSSSTLGQHADHIEAKSMTNERLKLWHYTRSHISKSEGTGKAKGKTEDQNWPEKKAGRAGKTITLQYM